MKILFFTHYFPPEGNAPASRTYENCKRWVREGHDVTVITCAPNVPDGVVYPGYCNKLFQKEIIDGIQVVRVWTFIAANKGTLLRILNFVSYMYSATFFSLFLKRPDIIISTSPQFFCGWAGILAGWLRFVPSILEIRDLWPETIVAIGAMKNNRIIGFLELLEKWMYRSTRHIVTVGEGYREKLLEKGVPSEKITVIPNGADFDFFKPRDDQDELKTAHQLQGKFVCSYIGTLGLCSGLEMLPRAAKLLKDKNRHDIILMIVGDGAIREDLESLQKQGGLDNLIITGRRKKEEIPEYIALADVCLAHLQKKDLFKTVLPSKIFEATAMKRPIIMGVEGHAARLIQDAGAGICIEPENETEFIQALETLSNNPEQMKDFGESGYQYMQKNYNRELLAQKYLQVLGQFIKRKSV